MQLTQKQIQEIENYISACGIKYYDVKMEIVDHFASKLEERLQENPKLDFKGAIIEEHKKFSSSGFKNLLENKEKTTQKRFRKMTYEHLKSFFKLPKIIISIAVFTALYQVMNLFSNTERFFQVLVFIGFLMFIQLGFRVFIASRKETTHFLVLNRTHFFIQVVNNMFLWFHLVTNFRTQESYLNTKYNVVHLLLFTLMLLVYWSMEYVYQQNRKEVQRLYPNVVV